MDRRFGTSQHSRMGRIFARGLEEDGEPVPPDQSIVQLGRIFAWVCTVFYLSSRMPQLWKNVKSSPCNSCVLNTSFFKGKVANIH